MYGILFDLDGTLVDSDPVHFEAWQIILAEVTSQQPLIDREFFDKHISGRNAKNTSRLRHICIHLFSID